MRINDGIRRYAAPLTVVSAMALVPALALGAEKSPTPGVTPTPPAERNIGQGSDGSDGQGSDTGTMTRQMQRSEAAGDNENNPTPGVTPTPPAERNIGQGSDTGSDMDRSQARRPDDEDESHENNPTPGVTPTPPAKHNTEQGG